MHLVGFYYKNVPVTLVNDTHKSMSVSEVSVVLVRLKAKSEDVDKLH